MAPKSAATAERLKKELAAQRARAEAMKHLSATSSGPSVRELAQEQRQRQQQTSNATSQLAQRRVLGAAAQKEQSAADKYDPRVRDNTLHAVALRRAQDIQTTQQRTARADAFHTGGNHVEEALPDGWKETVDPASGDTYYWNERTQETSWDRPGTAQKTADRVEMPVADAKSGATNQLEDAWEEVRDPASGDVYYWNRKTDATSWTRPTARSVSLKQALKAKSKLDEILKTCGAPASTADARLKPQNKQPGVGNAPAQHQSPGHPAPASGVHGSSASRKRSAVATPADRGGSSRGQSIWHANKKKQRRGSRGDAIDPMDPTGLGGKWSDGLVEPSERAPSSTAIGPPHQ